MMPGEEDIKTSSHLKLPVKGLFTWKNIGKSLHSLLDGTFLTRGRFRRAMPYILFLIILVLTVLEFVILEKKVFYR